MREHPADREGGICPLLSQERTERATALPLETQIETTASKVREFILEL